MVLLCLVGAKVKPLSVVIGKDTTLDLVWAKVVALLLVPKLFEWLVWIDGEGRKVSKVMRRYASINVFMFVSFIIFIIWVFIV